MNEIFLRRKGKILVKPGQGGVSVEHVAVLQKEAEHLGYVLSDHVIDRVSTLSVAELATLLRTLLKSLQALTGAHREYKPLYPGFPQQVLKLSEAQLYLHAVQHYITLRRMPAVEGQLTPLLHGRAPRTVGLGSVEEFDGIFTRLAGARVSLSAQDKADLSWFVRQYRADIFRLLPKALPFKENLALVGAQLLVHVPGDAATAFLRQHMKTATDVLRLAVAMSDGDASLAQATRFKPMKRSQRTLLLELVEQGGSPTEDLLRWPERWKRLGEVLHPGDYAERFPKTHAAFAVLRNGTPFQSFNSVIETQLRGGSVADAAQALQARPGEFARRLDHLLRCSAQPEQVVQQFGAAAPKVSVPVLLQVLAHFRRRGEHPLRAFFPKGDVAKVFALPDRRLGLPAGAAGSVAAHCEQALLQRFAKLAPLGRCYVDPQLTRYLVPLSQRSASKALRTLVRGSRLSMGDEHFARMFLWWTNGRGRVDIDLSAVLFGPRFEFIDQLSYYQLRTYGGYHSGDIVDAPQGAAEFIDLDLQRLRVLNVRFVVMVLNSYTRQPYCDLPECFAGWMAREDLNSGEPFEPRTVVDRIDVASDTQISLPLALDLEARQVLWMDVALKEQPRWNNVQNNLSGVSLMLRAISSLVKPDLHTLFSLHGRARGELVQAASQAQTVFAVHEGVTPFDVDRIRAEFL
jgi:hypothetical protein